MKSEKHYTLIKGDALAEVRKLKTASVDCVITSPPYWQLRDYGFSGQWGLESRFEDYLNKLYALMDEIKRVLKPQGTVWINLGDTYGTTSGTMGTGRKQPKFSDSASPVIDFKQSKPKAFSKSLLLI
ncbi:MAG: DNA methyltransferase, partial [Bacteroidota bacterium]